MFRLTTALLVCSVACGKPATKREHLQAGDIAFVGATVVPMDREGELTDQTVVVRGDRIVLVAPAKSIDTKGATVIDVKGKWLTPGLADMHVHTWSDRDFAMYLLNGVTTVRDMFGSPQHLQWRSAIESGKLEGPTLFTAGPIVDGAPPTWPGSTVVTTPDAAREAVRAQKTAGYDFIKIYNGLSAEAYDAIAAEAKAQGIPFAGHVPNAVGIEKAITSGQRSIEHLDGYIPMRSEPHTDAAIVAATAKSGVWNCPTLVVMDRIGRIDNIAGLEKTPGLDYVSAAVREQWNPKNDFRFQTWTPEMFTALRAKNELGKKLVADLSKAGAHLVLGTDTGNPYVVPGFAVHDELALLVEAGLTPWQAMRMATVAPADLVDQAGKFGVIAPGSRADLIVVDRDPTKDIGALAKPSLVVVRGKPHTHDALLAIVTKPPADPFASLPALEAEGEKQATANYAIELKGTVIGHERAVLSKLADGTHVVRGQAVYDMPQAQFQYRATPDGAEFADGLVVTRNGKTVTAKPKDGAAVELATTADAVVVPQSIAEYVWYADRLASLPAGKSARLTVASINIDNGAKLDPGTYTFKRVGERSFEYGGKVGDLDITGSFSFDADGAPHEIEVKVRWGTLTTKRVD
jgi:imidazolonepropionase-like amidohydrolase